MRKKASAGSLGLVAPLYPEAGRQTVALVTLLGIEAGKAARMVRAAQQRLTQFDHLVFVLSAPDLAEATRAGAIAELLPGPQELAGHSPDEMRRYLLARHDQILQKWQPDLILHYGLTTDAHVAKQVDEISSYGVNPF